jgi:hypothetical protein
MSPFSPFGFSTADITAVTTGEDAAVTCVIRATNGYHVLPRTVEILGRTELVVPGTTVLAVDTKGFWTRDCRIDAVVETRTAQGISLSVATGVIG